MTTKTFDLCAVYSEQDNAGRILNYAIIPMSVVGLALALIGVAAPWLLPMLFGLVATVTGLASWFYVQLMAFAIVVKMLASAIYYISFGDNDDYYYQ